MAGANRNGVAAWAAAALVALAAAAVVTIGDNSSRERIAANDRARLTARLQSVLDPALRGRDVRIVALAVTDEMLLGRGGPVDVFVALVDGHPSATVIANVAPQGYNGPIDLLVGIGDAGTVSGVRVVAHRETPGLGATIDADDGAWYRQFEGKALVAVPRESWAVKQDAGVFDALSGATVTSRATISAVRDALLYFDQHRDELYAAALTAPSDDAPLD